MSSLSNVPGEPAYCGQCGRRIDEDLTHTCMKRPSSRYIVLESDLYETGVGEAFVDPYDGDTERPRRKGRKFHRHAVKIGEE